MQAKEDQPEDEGIISKITSKIAAIPPFRLVMIVLASYFVLKNIYLAATEDRMKNVYDLPHDHEERVYNQWIENLKRSSGMLGSIVLIACGVFFLKYVNIQQERRDREIKEKEREIKEYEAVLEEIKEKKKLTEKSVKGKKKKN